VLLLVLILVLIAFSLLVVALLSGSVLWAWVSVGVSVAAALVLLIDYLQRRSAVKAGTEAGAVAGSSRTGSDPEPVTEVLPVIPRSGSGTAESSGKAGEQDASTAMFDQGVDSQQTVVMPVVQPPNSADRPSGASQGTTSSSGDSSPTVTTAGPGRSGTGTPSGEADDRAGTPDGGSTSGAEEGTAKAHNGGRGTAAAGSDEKQRATAGSDATAVVQGSGASTAEGSASAQKTGAEGTGAEGTAADSAPAADGEPPEEPRDAAAAAVVAGLENEVLVIDEQPRYHVVGCRALVGRTLIPLPAREAVELGFTPCGWCTPDRNLAAQQAAAR
jgi:hypothetical protein